MPKFGKPSPSSWTSLSFDGVAAAPDLDHPIYAKLVGHIPDCSLDETIASELQVILAYYAWGRNTAKGPTAQESKRRLAHLAKCAERVAAISPTTPESRRVQAVAEMREALQLLSERERDKLTIIAGRGSKSPWSDGRKRLKEALDDAPRLAQLAEEARVSFNSFRAGRPSLLSEKEACEALAELWQQKTGQRPTLVWNAYRPRQERGGAFLDLCRDAIWHVCDVLQKEKPDLRSVVEAVVSRRRRETASDEAE